MKKTMFVVAILITTLELCAQDRMELGVSLRTERQWYEQPFVWIAAACFFLYLMVLIIRKSERNN